MPIPTGQTPPKDAFESSASLIHDRTRQHGYLPPRCFKKTTKRHTCTRALWQIFILLAFVSPPFVFVIIIAIVVGGRSYQANSTYYTDSNKCQDDSAFAIQSFVPGNFEYSQAKAIDLTWNIVAGHGLQGIMAMVMYSVSKTALLRLTETGPVSYDFFAKVSLYPSNLASIPTLFTGIFQNHGWRLKLATIWIFLSCVIILMIPSILDAMTGYVDTQGAMLILPDSTIVPYGSDKYKWDLTVTQATLNGTVWRLPSGYDRGKEHIKCIPGAGRTYNWGFSLTILFSTCGLYLLWAIGTWGLWLDSQHNSQQHRKGRSMNIYSAMYDMSEAMRFEMGDHLGAYSGPEIEKHLKKRRPVMYTTEHATDGFASIKLSSRRANKFRISFNELYG